MKGDAMCMRIGSGSCEEIGRAQYRSVEALRELFPTDRPDPSPLSRRDMAAFYQHFLPLEWSMPSHSDFVQSRSSALK
jgi:hypothetical protein